MPNNTECNIVAKQGQQPPEIGREKGRQYPKSSMMQKAIIQQKYPDGNVPGSSLELIHNRTAMDVIARHPVVKRQGNIK